MRKILIIRFSSIGDIVLTSPVIRCLKTQLENTEIHFLTKHPFAPILRHDPHITRIHTIDKHVSEIIPVLRQERFECIIDLHHNLRSWQVIRKLGIPSSSFPKLNFQKWLRVNLGINRLPELHIVERYFKTVASLGVTNDQKGLGFYFETNPEETLKKSDITLPERYIAFVIGAKHGTKMMTVAQSISLIRGLKMPVVLLGGKEERERADAIMKEISAHALDLVGKTDLHTSAAVLNRSYKVVTHDTGLMHIAAALKKEVISVWGNTIPEFGMYPYLTPFGKKGEGHIFEVQNLKCRPCSKLGYEQCPKGHFDCMLKQDLGAILEKANS